MAAERFNLIDILPTLQNTEEYYERLVGEISIASRIIRLSLIFLGCTFLYGLIMGSTTGLLQALSAGVKVPVLFAVSFFICFPAFFLLQFILGSRLKLSQMVLIVLAGFVLTGAIMISFSPIIVLFMLTGGNYHFLQLLHVAVFVLSGLFGMKSVLDALKFSCDRKNVYPRTGVVVFRFWVVILAFVGIQLAWNLRPFLAQKEEPFVLFRKYEGNFYAAVLYSIDQLLTPTQDTRNARKPDGHLPLFIDSTGKAQ